MKKALIVIVMTLAVSAFLYISAGTVHASEYDITEESHVLVPETDDFMINGIIPDYENYQSTGYISLTMGLGNMFSINLSDLYSQFNYYESNLGNIASMYLLINLDTYYTSAVDGYWNDSSANLVTISKNVMKYTLNKDNPESGVSFSIWWARPGVSGGAPYTDTGGLRLNSITLVVEYSAPISGVVNVLTDYAALPDSYSKFKRIESFELYNPLTNSYHLSFSDYDSTLNQWVSYHFNVAIPDEIVMDQYLQEDDTINISYTTLEDGSRILYFQPDLSLYPIPSTSSGTAEDPQELLVGFITMNLTTLEYGVVKKLELDTITNKEANENAYLYAFYDVRVEEILSISFTYEYRIQNFFGLWYGEWQSVSNVYTYDQVSEVNPPLWICVLSLGVYLGLDAFNVYDVAAIEKITQEDIPDNVLDDYTDILGGSLSDLATLNLYKIYIGNFDGFIETGYDIKDVAVMNIMYVYNGTVYTASTEQIDQTNITPDLLEGIDWLGILSWLKANWKWIAIGVGGVLALVLLSKAIAAVAIIFKAAIEGITALIKGLVFLIGWTAKGIGYVLYFLVYIVPKGVITFVYILFTPAKKRVKNKRKEQVTYVSRSL